MKQNDIEDNNIKKLVAQQLENIFNVYEDNGMLYYNITRTVNFPEELDSDVYDLYSTTRKETWPNISYKFYNSVKLWWLICAVNNIQNPVVQPEAGTTLKILSPDIVRSVLGEMGVS